MKHSLTAADLEQIRVTLGEPLAQIIASSEPAAFKGRVPSAWIELASSPNEQAVRAVWEPATAQLPRFIDYLSRSVNGAAIAEVHGFPVLIMALPDWEESTFELGPGFCWMGIPTAEAAIERFVAKAGPIPPSLEALWRVANFITIKEGSLLCSLDPSTRAMTEAPVILPALADSHDPASIYECLQIAVVNDQMVTCLTRRPGQQKWDDHLIRYFRRTRELSSAVRLRLDDKLADWTFMEWPPPDLPGS